MLISEKKECIWLHILCGELKKEQKYKEGDVWFITWHKGFLHVIKEGTAEKKSWEVWNTEKRITISKDFHLSKRRSIRFFSTEYIAKR